MTATVFGEKKTSSGWFPLRCSFFLDGFVACMTFGIRLGPERGLVESLHHVQGIDSILARNCFDIAVVACRTNTELLENGDSLRIATLHIANNHIPADQLVEAKHKWRLGTCKCLHPAFQRRPRECTFLIIRLAGGLCAWRRHGMSDMPQQPANSRWGGRPPPAARPLVGLGRAH